VTSGSVPQARGPAGSPSSTRKPWLDWQRGLAVLFMVEVHVLDAWRAPTAGGEGLADVLRFVGGLAAPGFLYLAGVAVAFADAAGARHGVPPAQRRSRLIRRAAWLLAVAVGLRTLEVLAAALVQGAVPWSELVRIDILHVIALSLALAAWLGVGRGANGRVGPLLAGAAAVLVVGITPPVAAWLSTLALPGAAAPGSATVLARAADLALAVLGGRPPRATFCLLGWSAFLLAGAALGPLAVGRARPLAWLSLGAGLAAAGLFGAHGLPVAWWGADFWLTSPAWFAARLGLCAALTGAVQLVPAALEPPLRPLALLGRRSLLAYVASVELTYGGVAAPLRGRLGTAGTLAGIAGMTALTWALVAGWDAWTRRAERPGGS
jgi:hypothetical protein